MEDKNFLILFVFFIFGVFLLSNTNISGQAFDVSSRYCIDSDSGVNAYSAGFVKSDIGTFNDRCEDNLNRIREYSCDEGRHGGEYQVGNKVVECGSGFRCVRDVKGQADACVRG